MKYLIPGLVIFLCTSAAFSQNESPLMQMVNAEKSFAAYAGSIGITEAFLKYLSDSAKVFERGQVLNGKEVWRDRKTDSMELRWYPEFAEIAASGDFGYTTGPSEFRLKKGSGKADHKGYFNSIWKKEGNGEWKVLLDIGTPSPQSEYNESKVEYTPDSTATNKKANSTKVSGNDVIRSIEENFIKEYNGGKAYVKFGTQVTRYYRPGAVVSKGSLTAGDILKYKVAGTGLASSGDLGYAYGYVEADGKTGNYLRVWKKDTDVWRIVLDAATY
jgi:ketosteroid isomerase-like protein